MSTVSLYCLQVYNGRPHTVNLVTRIRIKKRNFHDLCIDSSVTLLSHVHSPKVCSEVVHTFLTLTLMASLPACFY